MTGRARFAGGITRVACLGLGLTLLGCGGSAAPPAAAPAPPPAPAPKPVAVAAPAPKPKPAAPAPAAAGPPVVVSKYPGEDPNNVFVTEAEAVDKLVASPAPKFWPDDQFAVAAGDKTKSSESFVGVGGGTVAGGTPRADFALPAEFAPLPGFGYSSEGLPLRVRAEKDKSVLALVSGGAGIVGSDLGPSEVTPSFSVFLDPYYMDVTEITIEQYNSYRQALREQKKRPPQAALNEASGPTYPALGIAFGEAVNYLRWAGRELPTEAEFEKAARGPTGFRFPWGDDRPIWSAPRTPATIAPVGRYMSDQSPYGIFDLAGNAVEWTTDWYSPTSHKEARAQAAAKTLRNWEGPKKAAVATQRTLKGGFADWSAWNRRGNDMSERLPNVGFRGVLRIKLPATPAAAERPAT